MQVIREVEIDRKAGIEERHQNDRCEFFWSLVSPSSRLLHDMNCFVCNSA